MATATVTSRSILISLPSVTSTTLTRQADRVPARNANPVVAFIIGLAIILLASVLNAAGLNLTKLDHVRTSATPKASRRKDWQRPLWLLGMLLYILSQLIGSTLALEYMRAEYVAPLGSTSLVFNFLFARFLVGTPVTSTDIYGTIVVVLGVIGIVAFGSINSGLAPETDVEHITYLWRRGGWLGFFFTMASALISLLIFTGRLDAVLAARSELSSFAGAGMDQDNEGVIGDPSDTRRGTGGGFGVKPVLGTVRRGWGNLMAWVMEQLEIWTAAKDDKQIAWTLGIGWACCGGGLAGGCLVFAKATVKLITGSLSHQNPGNQFGHAAPIFTILLLAATAVLQIICLNRGLKAYDSTLVVPVFYGVYTATGFLDSLIFNDEVDSYKSWTLFLIFVSILILISGVVLLTHKKPEPSAKAGSTTLPRPQNGRRKAKTVKVGGKLVTEDEEAESLREAREDEDGADLEEGEMLWAVGNDDSDDDDEHQANQTKVASGGASGIGLGLGLSGLGSGEEATRLMGGQHEGVDHGRRSNSSDALVSADPFRDGTEEFGEWEGAPRPTGKAPEGTLV